MNVYNRKSDEDRSSFSRTIQDLTTGFELKWGRSSRRAAAGAVVSADPLKPIAGDGGHGFLLTVYNGFPPGDLVRGLPWRLTDDQGALRLGFTDRRGQSAVEGLAEGAYYLSFESVSSKPLIERWNPAEFARIAGATEHRHHSFHSLDGTINARLAIDESLDRFMLQVDTRRDSLHPGALISVRITTPDGQAVAEGYVGLFELDEAKLYGELDLDVLTDGTIRSQIDPMRLGDLYVCAFSQRMDDFASADARMRRQIRDAVTRSIRATLDDRSQQALRDALGQISGQEG